MSPKVEIRASPIHGRGVFATEDIPTGEYITNYCPDEFIFDLNDENAKVPARCFPYVLNSPCGECVLVGDPECEFDIEHCGFLVNDPYKAELPESLELDDNLDALIDYYATGLKISNVSLGKKMFATRDIKKGEELTTNYEYGYWLTRKHKVLTIPDDVRRISLMCSEAPFLKIILEMQDRKHVPAFFTLLLETTKIMEREQMEKDKAETATS